MSEEKKSFVIKRYWDACEDNFSDQQVVFEGTPSQAEKLAEHLDEVDTLYDYINVDYNPVCEAYSELQLPYKVVVSGDGQLFQKDVFALELDDTCEPECVHIPYKSRFEVYWDKNKDVLSGFSTETVCKMVLQDALSHNIPNYQSESYIVKVKAADKNEAAEKAMKIISQKDAEECLGKMADKEPVEDSRFVGMNNIIKEELEGGNNENDAQTVVE